MSKYEIYNLRENPFPQAGTLNPFSKDPRENGEIFQLSLMADEVKQFEKAINDRLNLIYIMGLVHERGTGKSALLVHQLRKLEYQQNTMEKIWPIYIRCTMKEKPEHFCNRIIEVWHQTGKLWSMFEQLLLKYAQSTDSRSITEATVKVLFRHNKRPPQKLNLMQYFHISKPEPLARAIAQFVDKTQGANTEIVSAFIEMYLSEPNSLPDKLKAKRFRNADEIDIFGEFLRLMQFDFNRYHFVFLDQLEDVIANLTERTVTSFCLSMRRLLEVSKDKATYIVTLHPDSEIRLEGQAAKHLTTLAPLNRPHRIDLRLPKWEGDASVQLAQVYLDYYRIKKGDDSTFPFTPNAIKFVTFCCNRCIREILQRLYFTLDFAVNQQVSKIDYEFMKTHPEETVGINIREKQLKEFEREIS